MSALNPLSVCVCVCVCLSVSGKVGIPLVITLCRRLKTERLETIFCLLFWRYVNKIWIELEIRWEQRSSTELSKNRLLLVWRDCSNSHGLVTIMLHISTPFHEGTSAVEWICKAGNSIFHLETLPEHSGKMSLRLRELPPRYFSNIPRTRHTNNKVIFELCLTCNQSSTGIFRVGVVTLQTFYLQNLTKTNARKWGVEQTPSTGQ